VGRVVPEPVGVRQEGDITIVPVMQERFVKQWVLVEEIYLIRNREECATPQQVTLRRDHVVVERRDPETHQWLPDKDGS
jgi:stress response protein YsnF